MGRLGCPVLDIPHAEHPLIHHSSHPRIWCPISLQFWFVCTWRVKTDDTNDFEWEMYRAINIHNHLNFDLFIIWIIYGNLNATSLEWWLARVTIPKYVQPDFRVVELLHFVSRTHVCIYIWNITSYISLVLSTDVHPSFLQLPTFDPWPPFGERRPKKGRTQGGTPGCCSFTEVDEKLILMMCGHVANIVHTICALAGRIVDHSTVSKRFFFNKPWPKVP